jgi:hypothetical protein
MALIWIGLILLASVVWHPAPVSDYSSYFTLCGFKNLTGLPCPGCGLTHSFCSLAKGDVGSAIAFNLLGPILFVLLLLVWARAVLVLFNWLAPVNRFDRAIERYRVVKRVAIAFGVYGVARILYLLLYQSAGVQESPLARFVNRLFG